MDTTSKFRIDDSVLFFKYSKLIISAGFISAIITAFIRQFSGLSLQNEEKLIESIAEVTVHTLINLMALIGIFIVFWLQTHLREELNPKSNVRNFSYYEEFFTGFDRVYNLHSADLAMNIMASEEVNRETRQKRTMKIQNFREKSHYLLSLIVTIAILSYFFLFLKFLDFDIIKSGLLVNLKLIFSIFIIVICTRTFFLAFQFIKSVIQD
ncbi:MAG: hypothetical protein HXS44_02600 [Theionarchaea archaeon]|nr:hypothetical protein [Theionarchaea archaeon]